jgi:molybdopterin synthase catalytic subunit
MSEDGPMRSPAAALALIDVRDTPLSVDEVLRAVGGPRAGAVSIFLGTVRDHTPDQPGGVVTGLGYTAHPTALDELRAVAQKVADGYPDCVLSAVHRTGLLAVGDIAVIAAAAAPHRGEAFAACRTLIDTLKEQVPIWKREAFGDGSHTWVGI